MKYAVVIERGTTSYGAQVPDLAGCVATVETKAAVSVLVREAISTHFEASQEDERPITAPQAHHLPEAKGSGTTHLHLPCPLAGGPGPIAQTEKRPTRIAEVVGANTIREVRCIAYQFPIVSCHPRQTDIPDLTLTALSRLPDPRGTRRRNGLSTRVTNAAAGIASSAIISNQP